MQDRDILDLNPVWKHATLLSDVLWSGESRMKDGVEIIVHDYMATFIYREPYHPPISRRIGRKENALIAIAMTPVQAFMYYCSQNEIDIAKIIQQSDGCLLRRNEATLIIEGDPKIAALAYKNHPSVNVPVSVIDDHLNDIPY